MVILLRLASIVGLGFGACEHDEKCDIPGNCCAWFMFGPHCLFLIVRIANAAMMKTPEKSIGKRLTRSATSAQRGGYSAFELISCFGKLPALGKWMMVAAFVIVSGLINERFFRQGT